MNQNLVNNSRSVLEKNHSISSLRQQKILMHKSSSIIERITGISDKGLVYILIILMGILIFKLNKKFEANQRHLDEVTNLVKSQEKALMDLKVESAIDLKRQEKIITDLKIEAAAIKRKPASLPTPVSIINNIGDSSINRHNLKETKKDFHMGAIDQFFTQESSLDYKKIDLNYYQKKMVTLNQRDSRDRFQNSLIVKNELNRDLQYNFKIFSKYNRANGNDMKKLHHFQEKQMKTRMDFSRKIDEYIYNQKLTQSY